jgi:hypothetical protein
MRKSSLVLTALCAMLLGWEPYMSNLRQNHSL